MRRKINLNKKWEFTGTEKSAKMVNLPHTWNAIDGQNGGNNYFRGTCKYQKTFKCPEFRKDDEIVYIEFAGVNSSAKVSLNGHIITSHDGGYSTFRHEITPYLKENNNLIVSVDNGINDNVYPQMADFTFYGGIYRDVQIIIVNKKHFDLDYYGGLGIKITSEVKEQSAMVKIETFCNHNDVEVKISILDDMDRVVKSGIGKNQLFSIDNPHFWDGVNDPYLYKAVAALTQNDNILDEVTSRFGIRSFHMDPDKGFFLNGRSYPLRGVSRHQDYKGMGNAIGEEQHDLDMKLIREVGANSIRLAHYQHSQYFYDLCDEFGMVVWAEIPYISSHLVKGKENTINQMKELIVQNYNHPSIVTWGISNEITIKRTNKKDMIKNHQTLNDLCHKMDATRPTTLACYAMCSVFHPNVNITDIVGYNLYLGWYVIGFFLNDCFIKFFKMLYPKRCLSYSEYGAEGMPNLHSPRPKRGDNTEEYQAKYHEYMLKCFERNSHLWSTYVWNMFDFAADARNQGGKPGMNHKGLITFDRKTKKDSFYLYKAYWSDIPFIHLCGKRYRDRIEKVTTVKVYSNQSKVALFNNGKLIEEQSGGQVFTFRILLEAENQLEVVSGDLRDASIIYKTYKLNPDYKLKKGNSKNWF